MSLLKGIIEPDQAVGDVKSIYEGSTKRFGFVPNAIKMQSINPSTVKFYAGLSKYFVEESAFSEKLRLLANGLIAQDDSCGYCVSLMEGALGAKYGIDKDQLKKIKEDPSTVPLDGKEKGIFEFIFKVLKDSNSTSKDDIEKLYSLGWSDKDIFDSINFATQMQKMHIMLNAFKIEND